MPVPIGSKLVWLKITHRLCNFTCHIKCVICRLRVENPEVLNAQKYMFVKFEDVFGFVLMSLAKLEGFCVT